MPARTLAVSVPEALYLRFARAEPLSGLSVARQTKRLLLQLLHEAPPLHWSADGDDGPVRTVSVILDEDEQDLLSAWRRHQDAQIEDAALAGMLMAGAAGAAVTGDRPAAQPVPRSRLDQWLAVLGLQPRLTQQRTFDAILRRLTAPRHERRVLFMEASTGVGKTLAFLAAAADRLEARKTLHGVVAAPTLQVLRQYTRALESLRLHGGEVPIWGALFGKQEFISEQALRQHLAERPAAEGAGEARAWLDGGGKSGGASGWQRPWLADDLREASAGRFEIGELLRVDAATPESDAGLQSYKAQFVHEQQPALILCTHAMLAREILSRSAKAGRIYREEHGERALQAAVQRALERQAEARQRPGAVPPVLAEVVNEARAQAGVDRARLPPMDFLIIDEAHDFEANVAKALSNVFSCWALLEALRALHRRRRLVGAPELAQAESIYQRLHGVAGDTGGEVPISPDDAVGRDIRELKALVLAIGKRWRRQSSDRGDPDLQLLDEAQNVLSLVFPEEPSGHRIYLRHSPAQRRPQLICGRADVSVELDYLWRCMAGQFVLVSATLCVDGDLHPFEHMRRILAVPAQAAEFAAPVRPGWLTAPVRLLLPRQSGPEEGGPRFRPVSRSDEFPSPELRAAARRQWLEEVADYLRGAAHSAAGGSLVLLTSYEDCADLAASCRIGAERVIEMRRGMSLRQVVKQFQDKSHAGLRPLLFGVGGAWTGLDIGAGSADLEAARDNLLTDLVIPRIPFGANTTMTHVARIEHRGSLAESYAAAMLLKQGLGRLVRREGLPDNRRIHLLDGRLNDRRFRSFMAPVRQVLTPYERRELV
jgi:CRISPR type IV-associated DEAD/DEAH-box helicase Csf4